MWDIERLEVHRGPQSTLQGRNALAGAIVISSKNPTFEPEYRFRGLIGELGRREGALAMSGPIITDELAVRLSGEYSEKTSDIVFTDSGNEALAEDEYYNIRGKLLYKPAWADALQVMLIVNHVYDSPSSAPVSGPDFYERKFAKNSVSSELREMAADSYSANISYELSESITFRSISAYYDSDLQIFNAPGQTVFARNDNRKDADLTQEFRFEIKDDSNGFSGVTGLFYGSFENDVQSLFILGGSLVIQDGTFHKGTETLAAYADMRYRFNDHLSLIFGGRYQKDRVSNGANFVSDFGDQFADRQASFNVFMPKAGLSFEIDDNQTIGMTTSRGYRQGFAEPRFGDETEIVGVDAEYLWAYEVAYRVLALEKRLLLGVNVFYNDYKDQQITVEDARYRPFTSTFNAGDSNSYGLEIEAKYNFGNGLKTYATLGLLETKLGEFSTNSCGVAGCSGKEYSEAPDVTASLGGSYEHESGFFVSLSASYTGEFFKNISNSENLKVDSYLLVDSKLGYTYKNYNVSVYVNNLLNEDYLTGITDSTQATIGDARNVGVALQVDF